ncbi:hypothetical protein EBR03_09235, partial [bacterium]|nr:hypothetical protein [bacterium]
MDSAIPVVNRVYHRPTLVLHLGVFSDEPGGISSVLRSYLDWQGLDFGLKVLSTISRKHDPLSIFRFFSSLVRLTFAAVEDKNTVVIVHLSQRGSFIREGLVLRTSALLGLRTIGHIHGSDFNNFLLDHFRLVGWALKRANKVLFLSEASKNLYQEKVPIVLGQQIKVVKNVFLQKEQAYGQKEKRVIFAGEVGLRKGVDVLLDSWGSGLEFKDWTLL